MSVIKYSRSIRNLSGVLNLLYHKGNSILPFAYVSSVGSDKYIDNLFAGNFLCSFRPVITDTLRDSDSSLSVEWSDDLKSGKMVRLTGVFDKLSYRVRKALSVDPVNYSFSTASCILKSKDSPFSTVHFLIMSIQREVPVIRPEKSSGESGNGSQPVALQKQQEIYLLPTVQVSNLLHSDVHVILTEKGMTRCLYAA